MRILNSVLYGYNGDNIIINWLEPWTNAMTAISDAQRLKALSNPLFMFDIQGVIAGGSIQMVCLVAIIAISILKLWGRRDIKSKQKSTSPVA